MKRTLACLGFLFLCLAGLLRAQVAEPAKNPQRVLFLGDPASPRTADFAAFLGQRFTSVRTGDRWSWDRALLAEVDLVVLDWPQQDGISKWMLGKDRTVPPKSPLGARAEWARPTVLVGSAGLNTAWAWDVKGGWG